MKASIKDHFLVFIEKFNVPENLKIYIPKILNEEEVKILNFLIDKEEKISDIISKFPSTGTLLIKSLYQRGYLIRQLRRGENYYKSNTLDQILKRFVNHSQKFKDLTDKEKIHFQEFITGMYLKKMRASKKPVYRVVPIEETIQDKRQLIPYHKAIYYIQKSSALALIDCICRTTFMRCNKAREVCIALGEQAEFFVERGIGKMIDIQEGQRILDLAEESGLVHSINNKKNPNFLCNCCECCCVFVEALKKRGIITSIGKSGFIALLDLELCNQCGICLEKCIFGAISHEKEILQFDADRCFGCGLCAYNCPLSAIKLVLNENK
ncbi:MAG: hypothetical protein GTO16_11970 [Candidatus Aminicenantes bacterium]|nr:hypothetical protein [Candidatus Aminicenantes bacterium]